MRRVIWNDDELQSIRALLVDHYGNASSAAMVMAYVDGRVDFVTEEAHVDHVEGQDPRKLAHALKVMRSEGTDPVAFLNGQVGERWMQERLVSAMMPPPRTGPGGRLWAPGARGRAPGARAGRRLLKLLKWF